MFNRANDFASQASNPSVRPKNIASINIPDYNPFARNNSNVHMSYTYATK